MWITQIAYNPYEDGSWYNVYEGKIEDLMVDYKRIAHKLKPFDIQSIGGDRVGAYDMNKIDYSKPELYLQPGPQTDLLDEYVDELKKTAGSRSNNFNALVRLMRFYHKTFSGGGADDWRLSANDIYKTKKISGCTEQALIQAAILREMSFPTVLIVTVGLELDHDNNLLREPGSSGHQMLEVYVDGKWILLDGNGRYTKVYDPSNPFIIRDNGPDNIDYGFVLTKGLDYWEIGLLNDEIYKLMIQTFKKDYQRLIVPYLNRERSTYKLKSY